MPRTPIDRRTVLKYGLAGAVTTLSAGKGLGDSHVPRRSGLGIVMYDCNLRRKWMLQSNSSFDLFAPETFLRHCQTLGASGMQVTLGVMSLDKAAELRDLAVANDMFIEAIVNPPADRGDLPRFEAEIKTASIVGALAARTVIIPGRRYEHFKTFADFQQAEKRGQAMLELASPIVEKYRVPLAVENHKDQRIEDRVELLENISSAYIGACVDTGNSFALLDDLYGSIQSLAPFAFSVHFKDQALAEYDDGYLLGDIPLGQGSFDLRRMAEILRKSKPDLRFCLEVITRDGLKVPCLTESYWSIVPEASGSDLARTLRDIRSRSVDSPMISSMPLEQQVAVEDANITASLHFAGKELAL